MGKWPGEPHKEKTTFGGLRRSDLMARVRSYGNCTTELRMAKLLRGAHIKGWRRHLPLPGKPDFAWPNEKVALFVDGCFWHGHTCGRNLKPKVNQRAWEEKIEGNKRRDRRVRRVLRTKGWRVVNVWECELSKKPEKCLRRISRGLEASRNAP